MLDLAYKDFKVAIMAMLKGINKNNVMFCNEETRSKS